MSQNRKAIEGFREDGANVFRFKVNDAEQAFAAVLDVPGFYSTGNIYEYDPSSSDQGLDVFVITGFPVTKDPRMYPPKLEQGEPGSVGASYAVSFQVGPLLQGTTRRTGEVSVYTDITHLEDRSGWKELRLRHRNYGGEIPSFGLGCMITPQVLLPETHTAIRIEQNESGEWEMTLRYTGIPGGDPRELEGGCNYWLGMVAVSILCPCFLFLLPCTVSEQFTFVNHEICKQMERVQTYCNSYGSPEAPSTSKQGAPTHRAFFEQNVSSEIKAGKQEEARQEIQSIPLGSKITEDVLGNGTGYELAIPVEQGKSWQSPAEELDKWHQLYKDGAISQPQYEAQRERVLASTRN